MGKTCRKDKWFVVFVLPLKSMIQDIREVVSYTRGLFR